MHYGFFELLGTKAFLAIRKDMFCKELLACLEMIERGNRLVADQNTRADDQRTSNVYTLLLATGEGARIAVHVVGLKAYHLHYLGGVRAVRLQSA